MTMVWFSSSKNKELDDQHKKLKEIEREMINAKSRLDQALDELLNETASRKDRRNG